jgi:hypothetical protein
MTGATNFRFGMRIELTEVVIEPMLIRTAV